MELLFLRFICPGWQSCSLGWALSSWAEPRFAHPSAPASVSTAMVGWCTAPLYLLMIITDQLINRWTTGEVRLYYSVNIKVIFITKKGRAQKMDGWWMDLTIQSIYILTNSLALSVNWNIALHSSRWFFAGIINSSDYIKWLCNVGPWQTGFRADDLKLPLHCCFLCAYSEDVAALQFKSTLCPKFSFYLIYLAQQSVPGRFQVGDEQTE